ncbi:hypothetical protein DPMN_138211 [Dreissena polymorpha]|uniref:Uncharacterized protein n=1 Tax=Dreissena polymorpha TaxID=45954 RepID=A0A9D4G6P8_DREPO|nr:hypothetical protein DPMN_138211 [Dreissena polymorpha]
MNSYVLPFFGRELAKNCPLLEPILPSYLVSAAVVASHTCLIGSEGTLATSEDCLHFRLPPPPKSNVWAYFRRPLLVWDCSGRDCVLLKRVVIVVPTVYRSPWRNGYGVCLATGR